ncbi:hypothetical protein LTR86_008957 [Recurvomyces mirabilis]|nr:hypothetical protein LTR86_008957 [Recurvomyces mirabilis]
MAGDDEKRLEDDRRSDAEGRVDRDRKPNGERKHESAKKVDALVTLELKIVQFENKIALLESRLSAQESDGKRAGSKSARDRNAKAEEPRSRATSPAPSSPDISAPKPRVRVVVSRQDPDGERVDTDENSSIEAPPTKEHDNVATLWKYVWRSSGTLEVFDLNLCALLKRLLAHYPPFNHFLGSRVEIDSPYEPLIFNWDAIVAESELRDGDDGVLRARSDLRDLIVAIRKGSGDPKLDEYFRSRNDLRRENAITFDTLWTIFPPGTLVIGQVFLDEPQLFMVEDQHETWPRDNEFSRRSGTPTIWELDCFMYDYTGNTFQRQSVKLPFREFTGATPILQLPYRPLEALGDKEREEMMAKLLGRGQGFRDYCVARNDTRMYNYAGKAMIDHRGYRRQAASYDADDSDSDNDRRRRRRGKASVVQRQETLSISSTNVMVDYLSYFQHGPNVRQRWSVSKLGETSVSDDVWNCMCADCQDNEGRNRLKPQYDGMNGVDDRDLWEDLQFQLCAPRVLGYVLKDKAWAQFAVSKLTHMSQEEEKTVMSKLVLDGDDGGQSQKDLLLNLVKHHGMKDSSKYSLDDIVVDKGKGLVFLLYGAPGVGKTSTGGSNFGSCSDQRS